MARASSDSTAARATVHHPRRVIPASESGPRPRSPTTSALGTRERAQIPARLLQSPVAKAPGPRVRLLVVVHLSSQRTLEPGAGTAPLPRSGSPASRAWSSSRPSASRNCCARPHTWHSGRGVR